MRDNKDETVTVFSLKGIPRPGAYIDYYLVVFDWTMEQGGINKDETVAVLSLEGKPRPGPHIDNYSVFFYWTGKQCGAYRLLILWLSIGRRRGGRVCTDVMHGRRGGGGFIRC